MMKDRKEGRRKRKEGNKGKQKRGKKEEGEKRKKGQKKEEKKIFFFLFPLTSNLPWLCCSVVCHVMYLGFVVLVFVLLLNIDLSCECHP